MRFNIRNWHAKFTWDWGKVLVRIGINGLYSEWQEETSGISHGSIRPQLFMVYDDGMDEGMNCNVYKFADLTKLGRTQLPCLMDWQSGQMLYSVDNCEVIHLVAKSGRQIII